MELLPTEDDQSDDAAEDEVNVATVSFYQLSLSLISYTLIN